MKKQISTPLAVIVAVLTVGVVYLIWSATMNKPVVLNGADIQKPTGRQPDPSDMPPGGTPGATQRSTLPLPPGKGRR